MLAGLGSACFSTTSAPFPTPCLVTGARWVRKFTDDGGHQPFIRCVKLYPVVEYNAAETVAIVKIFMGDHAYLMLS